MELKNLLKSINIESNNNYDVNEITLDSRKVKEHSLLICFNSDYLTEDLLKKNIVILTNFLYENEKVIYVNGLENKYAKLIHFFYDEVTKKVKLIGITGTNGKTTIAYLMYRCCLNLGLKAQYIGTLGVYTNEKIETSINTTPSIIESLKMISQAYQEGVKYVFMEVSSHALMQNRVFGFDFDGAIFTNLTQDHLDYHGSMEAYAFAKKKLFDSLKREAFAILNADDSYSSLMVKNSKAQRVYYGIYKNVDGIKKLKYHKKIKIKFDDGKIVSSLIGKFNVYNLLAVYHGLLELGFSSNDIFKSLKKIKSVEGRMELIKYKSNLIIVDFAHTPDAFEKILKEVSGYKYRSLKVVFGCGGNRDRGKREIMGSIAEKYADYLYLTDDNARDDDEREIIEDILKGIKDKNKVKIMIDRRKAIELSLSELKKKEILLVLGRGHEKELKIKDKVYNFNDKKAILEWINQH